METDLNTANGDVFKTTMRNGTLRSNSKHRGSGGGAIDALEAARAAAAKESSPNSSSIESQQLANPKPTKRRNPNKKRNGGRSKSGGAAFEITIIDANAPAHHKIAQDPLGAADDEGDYGEDSFDGDDDGYEDDFEVVGGNGNAEGSTQPAAKPRHQRTDSGMVTIDVKADAGFEATLGGGKRTKSSSQKNASERKQHRKSSADAFNETATSRAGLPGRRNDLNEYATDDEVTQRTRSGGGGLGVSTDDNLPPLQPSRGSAATGRGGGRFSPLSSPPSGYVSDSALVSPLPNIKRRARQ